MSVYITCSNCGEKFEFTHSEQIFYQSKNFKLPRRCKDCRKIKKEDVGDIFKLGYKRSSYLDNARIYGPGVPVTGENFC